MRRLLLALSILALAAPAAAQTVDCAKPDCASKLSPTCLKRVGAGAVAAGDACRAEQDAYLRCVTTVAETCGQTARSEDPAAGCTRSDAQQLFTALQSSDDVAALRAFAEDCKGTPQARQAALRADRLSAAAKPAASPPARTPAKPSPRPAPAKPAADGAPDLRDVATYRAIIGRWSLLTRSEFPFCAENIEAEWTGRDLRIYAKGGPYKQRRELGVVTKVSGDRFHAGEVSVQRYGDDLGVYFAEGGCGYYQY